LRVVSFIAKATEPMILRQQFRKWTVKILCAMREHPLRLSALKREIPSASKKALTASLRSLETATSVAQCCTLNWNSWNRCLYRFRKNRRFKLAPFADLVPSGAKMRRKIWQPNFRPKEISQNPTHIDIRDTAMHVALRPYLAMPILRGHRVVVRPLANQ